VVIGALAPAIPEAAVGAANGANTTAVFFGHDPRHDRDYVYLETLGGGFGGLAAARRLRRARLWPARAAQRLAQIPAAFGIGAWGR